MTTTKSKSLLLPAVPVLPRLGAVQTALVVRLLISSWQLELATPSSFQVGKAAGGLEFRDDHPQRLRTTEHYPECVISLAAVSMRKDAADSSFLQAAPVYLNRTQPLVPNECVVFLSDCAVVAPTPMTRLCGCFRLDKVRLHAANLNTKLTSCQGVTRAQTSIILHSIGIRTLNASLGVSLL